MSLADADQKRAGIDAALGILSHAQCLYQKNGLCCDIVSAGGTGSLQQALRCPALTEVQAGGAIFGDPYYLRMPDVHELTPALTLLTTVVSRPSYERAVLDAGRKAITAGKAPAGGEGMARCERAAHERRTYGACSWAEFTRVADR